LLLESHGSIACLDEILAYRVLARKAFPPNLAKPLLGFKIPRWTEQLQDPLVRDYGLEERVSRLYSGEKLLFVVRGPEDTISSMLKLREGNRSWLEQWAIPIIEDKARECRRFQQKFAAELGWLRATPRRLAAYGALYWKYKNEPLDRYIRARFPVQTIRYEELVSSPERTLREVCAFLKVPWDPQMLRHPEIEHGEVFESGLTIGDTCPKRAIDLSSVNQWERYLTPLDLSEISVALAGFQPGKPYDWRAP